MPARCGAFTQHDHRTCMNQGFDGITNILDVYVRHLRSKIDSAHNSRLIRTVRGVGYTITAGDDDDILRMRLYPAKARPTVTDIQRHGQQFLALQGTLRPQDCWGGFQCIERYGRHVGTRTPDLYRVKVAL